MKRLTRAEIKAAADEQRRIEFDERMQRDPEWRHVRGTTFAEPVSRRNPNGLKFITTSVQAAHPMDLDLHTARAQCAKHSSALDILAEFRRVAVAAGDCATHATIDLLVPRIEDDLLSWQWVVGAYRAQD